MGASATAPESSAKDGAIVLLLSPLTPTVVEETTAAAAAPDASDIAAGGGDAPVPEGLRTYLDPSERILATCVNKKLQGRQKSVGVHTPRFRSTQQPIASWSSAHLSGSTEVEVGRHHVACLQVCMSFVPRTMYGWRKKTPTRTTISSGKSGQTSPKR